MQLFRPWFLLQMFCEGVAVIAKPLHKLTELDAPYDWTPECQQAFETLRHALTMASIHSFPIPGKPFITDTDASGVGLGPVLSQERDDLELVIAYYCRCLSKEEPTRTLNGSGSHKTFPLLYLWCANSDAD